jgi:hypothetical protein
MKKILQNNHLIQQFQFSNQTPEKKKKKKNIKQHVRGIENDCNHHR